MGDKTVLLTGGAGYIGSHVALDLLQEGYEVIILDDLSKGFAAAVTDCELVEGDTGNKNLLALLLGKRKVAAVMHFAGSTIVPESVEKPLRYYENNTVKSRNLVEVCVETGVRHFVFSSTAAVYGIPESGQVTLQTPTEPVSPYGMSKLMTEIMLRDVSRVMPLKHAILRYFNVAGADPEGRIGQSTPDSTLLIKVACEAALGKRAELYIYGTDYPTPDGTGVRDYIHVSDLAAAHVLALRRLEAAGESTTLNCGYGHGYSVREVVRAVEQVHDSSITVVETGRRPGDPPMLVADGSSAKEILGWRPRYDDLEFIVRTSYDWEKNPRY
ncbi:MAG: UDP-glucose 4-epimerase GalE [Gammaproteobacteria bacterium]|nr:UDP-glucose 4-epimerase GalE [Gammaproteobacteria bacterium]